MDFSRVYELHMFFSHRRYLMLFNGLLSELGYVKITFYEIKRHMCDYLGSSIKNMRGQDHYYVLKDGEIFELPGFCLMPVK
jgi:hypothetical protein